MSKKLVGFGELLLRLDTPGHERISQAESYHARFTGGEANVCVAARRFGVTECAIVSQVPDHAIGDACLETLNRFGVDTSSVIRQGERLGILFVENGVSLRPSNVLYDRSHTSFRNADPEGFRWDQILTDAGVLHISGTAPALGAKVNRILEDILSIARPFHLKLNIEAITGIIAHVLHRYQPTLENKAIQVERHYLLLI